MTTTAPSTNEAYSDLLQTVAILRAPGGCPWDREQTHASLTECLIEECSELIEAIDNLDYNHMLEELGDVLLNVVMQTEIAREAGRFSMEDVAREVNEKLIRRHPHVFAPETGTADTPEKVLKRWDEIKAGEKPAQIQPSPFKPQPPRLPALLFAKKTYKQVVKQGLENHPAVPSQMIGEISVLDDASLAKHLFSIAATCRLRGIDPEQLLRGYTDTLVTEMESALQQRKDPSSNA